MAKKITKAGGKAQAAVINALNDGAVNEYIDGIVKHAGKIDILLDAAGPLARESTATERLPWNCRLRSSWCR